MSMASAGPHPDVAIIGAGVMGAATAFWLTHLHPGLRVVLIEADPGFARASSALSASAIRQQFSCAVNIRLSQFGIGFLREARQWLGDDAPPPALHEAGFLYLANEAQAGRLRELNAIQRAHGADVVLLAPRQIRARFPWLDTADIALGSLGLSGEGWFDGPALHQSLLAQARRQGAQLLHDRVLGWECGTARVESLQLQSGGRLAADRVVLAAGAWSGELAALAGIALPIEASRRTVFVLSTPAALPGCPLLIDSSGFWLRPEGRLLITGREPDRESHALALDPDWSEFDETQWARLAARIPALAELRVERAWAGYYEMNRFDHNAVIGPHPELRNLHFITGFSGHGMQHAPGAGLALAEWMLEGAPHTVDVRALGFARLARGEPLRELNVIG
jgi:glycine/D-amino acid oxidase-like deaminating enzyme